MQLPDVLTTLFNRIAFKKEMLQELIIDKFYNKISNQTFEAMILTELGTQSQVNQAADNEGTAVTDEAKRKTSYYYLRVRPLQITQYILPDPMKLGSAKEREKMINAHPLAQVDIVNATAPVPKWGQIWQCRFTTNQYRGIVLEKFLRTAFDSVEITNEDGTTQTLTPDDVWTGSGTVGDFTPAVGALAGNSAGYVFGGKHRLEKIEMKVNPSPNPVIGIGSPLAASQAQAEINWWLGKKEQDPGYAGNLNKSHPVFKRIQMFHHYVAVPTRAYAEYESTFLTDSKVGNTGVSGDPSKGYGDSKTGIEHWSATSISWVMRGTNFPRYYGHTYYSGAVQGGKAPGWEAHSLLRETVKIQLGDVLVRTGTHGKGPSKYTAAHGDVVYKIEGNVAHLSGGNLGSRGTFKEAARIPLDANGYPTKPGRYIVILKKMS